MEARRRVASSIPLPLAGAADQVELDAPGAWAQDRSAAKNNNRPADASKAPPGRRIADRLAGVRAGRFVSGRVIWRFLRNGDVMRMALLH